MVFADQRYARQDKLNKIPDWIRNFLDPGHIFLSTDVAVQAAKSFLLQMSQPFEEKLGSAGASLLTPAALEELRKQEAVVREGPRMAAPAVPGSPLPPGK